MITLKTRIHRRILNEAFGMKKKKLGEIPFKNTSTNDQHIKDMINHTAQSTGVPVADLMKAMGDSIKEITDLQQYSPFLYETIAKNAVEQAAFDLIKNSTKIGNVHFEPVVFNNLIKMVQQDHSQFFPLRAPNDNEYVFSINPILVPSSRPEYEKFNSVDTAAATGNGDFIFNVPFMEKLIDFASAENLKPQGKKYESNGGTIPDAYGYIEFLIIHELLHYSYGDFAQGQLYDQFSHKEHNWASDFRSNYMLVKNGYSQLPIGLFSDHINYDRQGSYFEMVKLVHDELAKLPKSLQQQAQELLDKLSDEHEHADQQDSNGSGAKAGEIGKDGKVVDPDAVQKEIEEKLSGKKDTEAKAGDQAGQSSNKKGQPSKGGSDIDLKKVDLNIKPKFNWKTLLAKCVSSSKTVVNPSYAKPSRRSITGAVTASQVGAGAMKPGDKVSEESNTKLLFVFDTSGSMGDSISMVLSETRNLLKQHSKNIDTVFGITFFASNAQFYEVNINGNYYAKINSLNDLGKSDTASRVTGYEGVLQMAGTGGTDFSPSLVTNLETAASAGYNVMIFSDSDMAEAGNMKNLQTLYSASRNHIFFIADSAQTFRTICNAFGLVPQTFSHF